MIAIENQDYIVKLNLKGGQIESFHDKKLAIEYMHDSLNFSFPNTNPIFFPIIGSSHDQQYHFNGQKTSMPDNGILKDAVFNLLKNTKEVAVLEFVANSETLKKYPFYFKILLTYKLNYNQLLVEYEIINDGVIDLPFNFGLKNTFNLPLTQDKKFEDYKLIFSSPSRLLGCGLKVNEGLISELALKREDFKKWPSFIYHNINSAYLDLSDGLHGIKLSLVGFPLTTVSALTNPQAKFLSIGLWLGLGKKTKKDLAFKDRDATMNIKPNKTRLITYSITVY